MSIFICGTDTGVGKTFTAASILLRYRKNNMIRYWKPVQTGYPDDDDRAAIQHLTELPDEYFIQTGFLFRKPLSPHRAAELENRNLNLEQISGLLNKYSNEGPLLVEGAGGLMVPINRRSTWIDFLTESSLPVVISARSGLGTINHTLLTIDVLRQNNIEIIGIVFCGSENPDNMKTVCEFSGVPIIGAFGFPWHKEGASEIDPDGILVKYLG